MGLKKDTHELNVAPPVASSIMLETPTGDPLPCPVDFATTSFDLTAQGGAVAETFADGDALATRWTTLTSFVYTYNAVSCELETADVAAPALPPIVGTPPVVGMIPIEGPNGETVVCPVDFALTTFDMTPYGGTAADTFADGTAYAAAVTAATAFTWVYNATTCVLESFDVGSPVNPPVVITPPVVEMIPLEDPFGNPAPCPVDFVNTTFNMSAYGGTVADTFVDGNAYAAVVSASLGIVYTYNAVTCDLETVDAAGVPQPPTEVSPPVSSIIPPVDDNGNPVPCPIDFTTNTFDMTNYGGTAADVFVDGNAWATAVSLASGFTYGYNAITCALESYDVAAPPVPPTLPITPPITSMVPPEDPNGNTVPCPVDFVNTTFDMTPVGGTNPVTFADGDAWAISYSALTGFFYYYEATDCSLYSYDAGAPAVPPVTPQTPPVVGDLPLEDPSGNLLPCPVNFAATTFDMTPYGGGVTDVFANGDALATFVTTNDAPNVWFYNSVDCSLESYSTGSPTGPSIVGDPPEISTIILEGPFGNPNPCPVDFVNTTFDMTAYGGTATDTFADGNALAAAVSASTGFVYSYNAITCAVESSDPASNPTPVNIPTDPPVSSTIPPVDMNGNPVPCPIDFTTNTFDMTNYGGTAADTFADGTAWASAVSTASGFIYSYDGVTCSLVSFDPSAPAVPPGIPITPPVTSTIPPEDPNGNPVPCPIVFGTTTFDMTNYGGTATDTFVDGDAWAAAITAASGFTYFYDSVTCDVFSYDPGAPAVPPGAPITPPVVGELPLEDPNGNPVPCPVDFVTTTFDMTVYGGTATDTFADGAALATFVTTNDAPNIWFYNATACSLESYTTGSPTGPSIPTTPPVTDEIPVEDPNGNMTPCPINFVGTTFDMTPFGGTAADTFADGDAWAAAVTASAGIDYFYNSVTCVLFTYDPTATDLPPVVVMPPIVGLLPPETPSGTPADCPVDFAVTVFDLTGFGGLVAEMFADGDAYATRVTTLTGFTFYYQAVNCSLISYETGAPTGPPVTVTETRDVSVTKAVDEAAPQEGTNVVFTITVSVDSDDITGVVVNDLLPAGVTYVSDVPSVGTYDDVTGVWTVGSLTSGADQTLMITASVDAGTAGNTITNTSTVLSDANDPNLPNNTATADIVPVPGLTSDLQLTKGVDNATPVENTNVVFTINVNNAGPDADTNVTVTDILPAGLTFVSSTETVGTYNSGTGIWTIGGMANGAAETLTITASVNAGTGGTTINNAGVIVGDNTDGNLPNNTDNVDIMPTAPLMSDMAITKMVDNNMPMELETITFTLTATNNGPDDNTNVNVADLLPASLTYVSDTPSVGTYDEVTGNWTIPALANAASATLTIVATVNAGTAGTNFFNTSSISGDNQETVFGNNNSNVLIDVQGVVSATLVKTSVVNGTFTAGNTITYSFELCNTGNLDITSATMTDTLIPSGPDGDAAALSGSYDGGSDVFTTDPLVGVNLVEGQAVTGDLPSGPTPFGGTISNLMDLGGSVWSFQVLDDAFFNAGKPYFSQGFTGSSAFVAGSVVNFTLPLAPAGCDTQTVDYTITAADELAMSVTNTATVDVAADNGQMDTVQSTDNLANPPGTPTVTVPQAMSDLAIVKSTFNTTPSPGEFVGYQIQVTNNGPNTDTNVSAVDVLPTELLFQTGSASPSQGTYNEGTNTWNIGTLTNGQVVTLNYTVQVDPATPSGTVINNTASVSGDGTDGTPANDTSTATITATIPNTDVSVVKSANTLAPSPGDPVVYTVVVTNSGPDSVGPFITDNMPAGITVNSVSATAGFPNNFGQMVQWSIPPMGVGASETLTINATVGAGVAIGTALTNTANLNSPGSDQNNTNNSSSVTLTVSNPIDLSVAKVVDNPSPSEGSNVTFTVTASNLSATDAATGVVVNDLLPAGLTYVSDTPSVGTYDNVTGIWTIGGLATSSSATLDIVATADVGTQGTTITNTATISGDQTDPAAANNTATVDVMPNIVVVGMIPIEDPNGVPICPVDFATTTFDLTSYGGSATASFADGDALAGFFTANTAFTWIYNSTICEVQSADVGSPVDPPIEGTPPVVGTIDFENQIGGAATCPLVFAGSTFDMTNYGGTATDTFANEAALEAAIEAGSAFSWGYDSVSCTFASYEAGAADDTIVIVQPPVGSIIPVTPGGTPDPCPIDWATTTWDMTALGGIDTAALFTDEVDAAVAFNAANGFNWSYDSVTCTFFSFDPGSPTVNIPVDPPVMAVIIFEDIDAPGVQLCPLDFTRPNGDTLFDMLAYSGNFNDVFVDENGLIAAVDASTGLNWFWDAATCELRTYDAGTSDTIIVDLQPSGIINLELPGGAPLPCPVNFPATPFDMTAFGGTSSQTFPNETDMATFLSTASGFTYLYDNLLCVFFSNDPGAGDASLPSNPIVSATINFETDDGLGPVPLSATPGDCWDFANDRFYLGDLPGGADPIQFADQNQLLAFINAAFPGANYFWNGCELDSYDPGAATMTVLFDPPGKSFIQFADIAAPGTALCPLDYGNFVWDFTDYAPAAGAISIAAGCTFDDLILNIVDAGLNDLRIFSINDCFQLAPAGPFLPWQDLFSFIELETGATWAFDPNGCQLVSLTPGLDNIVVGDPTNVRIATATDQFNNPMPFNAVEGDVWDFSACGGPSNYTITTANLSVPLEDQIPGNWINNNEELFEVSTAANCAVTVTVQTDIDNDGGSAAILVGSYQNVTWGYQKAGAELTRFVGSDGDSCVDFATHEFLLPGFVGGQTAQTFADGPSMAAWMEANDPYNQGLTQEVTEEYYVYYEWSATSCKVMQRLPRSFTNSPLYYQATDPINGSLLTSQNIIRVLDPTDVALHTVQVQDSSGNVQCPLYLGTNSFPRTWNLAPFGGSASFAAQGISLLLSEIESVTGAEWVFDPSDCTFKSFDTSTTSLPTVLQATDTCHFLYMEDQNGLRITQFPQNTSIEFDMTPLGGAASETFATEGDLQTRIETLSTFGPLLPLSTSTAWKSTDTGITSDMYIVGQIPEQPDAKIASLYWSGEPIQCGNNASTGAKAFEIEKATIDLTSVGLTATENFAEGKDFATVYSAATGQTWFWNEESCQLVSFDPAATDTIINTGYPYLCVQNTELGNVGITNQFTIQGPNGGFAAFNATSIGGSAMTDPAAFNSLLFSHPYNFANALELGKYIGVDAPPGDIAPVTYSPPDELAIVPLVDGAGNNICPIQWDTATFDLTGFGGSSAEVVGDFSGLIARIQMLLKSNLRNNAEAVGGSYGGSSCNVEIQKDGQFIPPTIPVVNGTPQTVTICGPSGTPLTQPIVWSDYGFDIGLIVEDDDNNSYGAPGVDPQMIQVGSAQDLIELMSESVDPGILGLNDLDIGGLSTEGRAQYIEFDEISGQFIFWNRAPIATPKITASRRVVFSTDFILQDFNFTVPPFSCPPTPAELAGWELQFAIGDVPAGTVFSSVDQIIKMLADEAGAPVWFDTVNCRFSSHEGIQTVRLLKLFEAVPVVDNSGNDIDCSLVSSSDFLWDLTPFGGAANQIFNGGYGQIRAEIETLLGGTTQVLLSTDPGNQDCEFRVIDDAGALVPGSELVGTPITGQIAFRDENMMEITTCSDAEMQDGDFFPEGFGFASVGISATQEFTSIADAEAVLDANGFGPWTIVEIGLGCTAITTNPAADGVFGDPNMGQNTYITRNMDMGGGGFGFGFGFGGGGGFI